MVQKIPDGFTTLTPSLTVRGAAEAIALYTQALGAKELYRTEMPGDSGKIMHACLMIGNSKIFLNDASPDMNCGKTSASSFYVYLEDVDAAFKRARDAGLEEAWPVSDMFWGDRMGVVKDRFGISWTLATHVRDVSSEEMEEAKKNFCKAA